MISALPINLRKVYHSKLFISIVSTMNMQKKNLLPDQETWVSLAKKGLILGPEEKEESFLQRSKQQFEKNSLLKEAQDRVFELFMMRPEMRVEFSKKGLKMWEGGYFDGEKMVLHPSLAKRKKLWGYSLVEILSHELVHAIRVEFNEKIFEEILAYQTSFSSHRRFLGSIFRSQSESLLFFSLSLILALLSFFSALPLLGILGLWGFFLLRQFYFQRKFRQAVAHLAKIVGEKRAKPAMIFLKDEEILNFSSWEEEKIKEWLKSQPSMRFEQLRQFLKI